MSDRRIKLRCSRCSCLRAAPEKELAVLVVTNQGGDRAGQACHDAAVAMVARFFGAP